MCMVLITGLPGVGKTTVIKKLSEDLRKKSIKFQGFYTEEVRDATGTRTGFDISTFDGQRSPLARVSGQSGDASKLPKVGKYAVHVGNFENLAMPVLAEKPDLLIIDEIGKMELLSKKFEAAIKDYVTRLEKNTTNSAFLIATIPNHGDFPIIDQMKAIKTTKIFTITKQNRTNIYHNIFQDVCNVLRSQDDRTVATGSK